MRDAQQINEKNCCNNECIKMKSDAHKLNEHGFVKLRSLCILEGRIELGATC
jgi:hypothetical protein